MLKNYFKIFIRNLKRNKTYSAINILGLSIGITSSILIMLNSKVKNQKSKGERKLL
jgi:putative ABC transport system permease protein